MEKINIVVYGDSNTYGYSPDGSRYEERYGTILNKLLGDKYIVNEEGVIGRTTIYPDKREGKIAIDTIEDDLKKYNKIDLLIIMLGTNDYKQANARSLNELEYGMNKLLLKIKEFNNISNTLILSPILLAKNIEGLDLDFDHYSYLLSTYANNVYRSLAQKYNLLFLDAKEVAFAGSDGEHFTKESHISLGNNIYRYIRENNIFTLKTF